MPVMLKGPIGGGKTRFVQYMAYRLGCPLITLARMKNYGAMPIQQFFARFARRRSKKITVLALARKLLTTA